MQTQVVAGGYLFQVPIRLGALTPTQVMVELYATGLTGQMPLRILLQPPADRSADGDDYHYQALVTTTRPASDFTARILPACEGIAVPLEDQHICWQR